ncbi:TrmO family methyltransferase domain-containing protein [Roseospira visakhapatnamensis]|uniref:tRNA-Thr(GGU) m(6)t(6)A37 methyltransferase TsaA n=1 Tax=Roseospira visakhapatnamensis TaxID=390880 RepID=A0A7W6RBH6_9PROT|nr:TrmO family methyltransferase [Roseospira visakhapatnamensis]MBB4265402.1 tRNA-Thr(GGU) m(6)t(6)A37 methyltransferase TsaA [Roseospira visakhapatnamensis]
MGPIFGVRGIGETRFEHGDYALHILPAYRDALEGLQGFSHAIALWWAHDADSASLRDQTTCKRPYTSSKADVGIFASRSEARPNPIGMSVFAILEVDVAHGIITTPFIDTHPNTPLIDIKPYVPALDRVDRASIPQNFAHWPKSLEDSACFDWSQEFERCNTSGIGH